MEVMTTDAMIFIGPVVLVFGWLILERFLVNRDEEKKFLASQKKQASNKAAMLEMFKDADSQSELLKRLAYRKEFFENWKTTDYRFLIWALAQIQLKEIEGQINRRKSPFYQYIEKS